MNREDERALPTQDEIYKLVKENNRILKAMRRDAFVGGVLKFVFWVVILFIVPYFVYVTYIAPQIAVFMQAYENVETTTNSVNARLQAIPDFGNFFEQFEIGGGQ